MTKKPVPSEKFFQYRRLALLSLCFILLTCRIYYPFPDMETGSAQPASLQVISDSDSGEPDPGDTDPGNTDPGTEQPVDPGTGDPDPVDPKPGDTGQTQPDPADPGTTDPGTTDPGTTEPGTSGPGTTDPNATDPGAADPDSSDPGTTGPGTTDPGTTEPNTPEPGTTEPDPVDPDQTGALLSDPSVTLLFGPVQEFRYRHGDINILGNIRGSDRLRSAHYTLNGGSPKEFLVKGLDPAKDKTAMNRLKGSGDFNIEIPVDAVELRGGENRLRIVFTESSDRTRTHDVQFSWNPDPVPLPADFSWLSSYRSIQEVGQVVDGRFEIDHARNLIRTVEPVSRDSLLLLGSPGGSQEATYGVRFTGTTGTFLGLSDFFVSHNAAVPDIGIKPGWSSAGLVTVYRDPSRSLRMWIALNDLLEGVPKWVIDSSPAMPFAYEPGRVYRVRHQVLFERGVNRARFRIWEDGTPEPEGWILEESDREAPAGMPKHTRASFGLFQFYGSPTEWFDIRISPLNE